MTSFLFLTHIFIGTFTNDIIGDRHIEHPPIHGSDGRHNLFFERLVEFHIYTFFYNNDKYAFDDALQNVYKKRKYFMGVTVQISVEDSNYKNHLNLLLCKNILSSPFH